MSLLLWLWLGCQPKPLEYTVVRGDTLFKIARAHDVTVDELREWNGIEGDLIEVDQVLLIYLEGEPEAADAPKPKPSGKGKSARKASPTAAPSSSSSGLSMPSPEPCLDLQTEAMEAGDEMGVVASAGLRRDQVKPPLDAVLPHALQCPRDDDEDSLRMVFEITVGCDGLVDDVRVDAHGGASDAYLDCVADVLRFADFPGHDMPDGMSFHYPVTVSW